MDGLSSHLSEILHQKNLFYSEIKSVNINFDWEYQYYADEQQSILWAHTVQRYMLHLYDAHFLLMKSKNILLLVTFVSNLVETDF